MTGNSWVTLATNDSYSLGALVLGHSLKRTGTVHSLSVMVTPGVSSSMREQLSTVFNVVQEVNILDSKDEENLSLLTRPELGVTFTKLHCWKLTQFTKCVFLDADVLVLRNCDELFEREELSAAPDVGWPDCFNSGVFVYRPSIETYNAIINLALSQGSFDGGDQGLLNQFFSDWATKDISRHLPFIYNMCSSATYSYLPAFKQFGKDVKIIHFIGSSKPWLQYLDSETRQVRPTLGSEHLQGLLQLWWDIFCNDVHSKLSSEMVDCSSQSSQLQTSTMSLIVKEILLNLQPEHSLKIMKPSSPVYKQDPSDGYWDPWETYQEPSDVLEHERTENSISSQNCQRNFGILSQQLNNVHELENNERIVCGNHIHYESNISSLPAETASNYSRSENSTVDILTHVADSSVPQNNSHHSLPNVSDSNTSLCAKNGEQCKPHSNDLVHETTEHVNRREYSSQDNYSNVTETSNVVQTDSGPIQPHNIHRLEPVNEESSNENRYHDGHHSDSGAQNSNEHVSCFTHPEDSLDNKTFIAPDNHNVSFSYDSECLTPSATTEQTESEVGLAGALSQLTLGVARSSEQIALEEHLRKQAWEHGSIDYMGRDSFDNIWRKICQTLAEPLPGTDQQPASSV